MLCLKKYIYKPKRIFYFFLGKSLTIINVKISIEPNDWLVPIRESYPQLEEEFEEFEKEINSDKVFSSIYLVWLP